MPFIVFPTVQHRTIARKSSIGGFTFDQGAWRFTIWKKSTDLQCFAFQFRESWSYVWGAKPTKVPPMATTLVQHQWR